ncbi:hypothetical protein pb186bvf_010468 [Paramecium bursaria]
MKKLYFSRLFPKIFCNKMIFAVAQILSTLFSRISIFYWTSADSQIGIRNLNIYTNGYILSNGCSMEQPYLQDTQCVKFCSNPNAYLSGVDMLVCQTDMIGQSSLIGSYLTSQLDLWQFTISESWVNPSSSQFLINSNLYTNIMYSDLLSSTLNCQQQCFYITQNILDTYLLQISFVFYIFGEWDDGSQVGLFIAGDTIYQNNMVKIGQINGKYYSSTGSDIYFTNITSTTGILKRVRWTLITFQGKFYSSIVSIGFSQQIYGSGSYGFGDIYVYQSYNDPKIVSSGLYGIPYQCIPNYYAYNGYCVEKCPPYSFLDDYYENNNCTDLAYQQSTIYQMDWWVDSAKNMKGFYIIKDFYNNNFNNQTINQIFNIIPPTFNNYQNGQPFSFIGNKKILGGYNSWGSGSYGFSINLPIHNQIRIQFTFYLIGFWQRFDRFQYYIDGNLIQELTQRHDQTIYVSNTIPHNQQQMKLMFTCTLQSRNSMKASCGISDLFVLYDQFVDTYCNFSWLYYYSYFTNNCEQCLGNDCYLYPDYYISFNSKSSFGCMQIDQYQPSLCWTCIEPNYIDTSNNGICECAPQYTLQNGQCEMCHYSCKTCFGISQFQCETCQPNRQLSNLNSCQCQTSYIDIFATYECQIINYTNNCHQSCLKCSSTQYHQCVACPINSFRILNQYNVCLCNQQYMDVGSQICQKIICDLTCLTCNGLLESNCITCATNFIFDNGYCICNGLFNNLVNINICQQNNPNCNQIQCSDQFISGFMDCDPIQFRYLIIISSQQQICACIDGYYDQQGVCEVCDSTCLTCSNLARCLTCDEKMNRILNIYKCECIIGYNDKLNLGQVCVQNLNNSDCHFSCSECFGTSQNQCLTCIENRYLSQQSCLCQKGYFELQGGCDKCHYSCLSCSTFGSLNCIDCNIYHLRILDNNQCQCITGYADVGNQQCEVCPHDCGECNSSLKCVTCKIQSHILNTDGFCDCQPGYQKDLNQQCVDCQSIQGRTLDLCQYTDSNDGVWTYGEKCDDGNIIARDGCTQFLIDKGYQCDNYLLQPSICYKCPTNCQKCYFNETVQCQTCIENYFQHDGICYQCYDSNCLVCQSQTNCIKCINDIIPINGQCLLCKQGYEYKNRECKSICGDGMLTQQEQCDDHNVYNNDGCNEQCQIEPGFICNPECKLEENVIKAKLLEQGNKLNNIQIEILYYQFNVDQLNVKIEYLNINEDYKYKINMITERKFEIQFTYAKTLKQFNIIHIYLPIKEQKRLLDYQIREYTFTPVETDYYDSSQISQRQTIQNTQKQFYQSLAYIGPITLIIGGTGFFLQILDIISWINNFYYINVNYPGNVQIFFEKANWALIFTFPQICEFQTDNLNQIPKRFQDKGIDGLLINNIQQIIFIFITIIICIYVSRRIRQYIQRYQSRNKQVISLLQNDLIRQSQSDLQVQQNISKKEISQRPQINDQNKINRLLQQLSQKLQIFYKNRYLIILQIMNTLILDIFLGLFINLKYQNYYNDFISFLSLVFCILFGILSMIFFYLLYIIVTGHKILKKLKIFRNLVSQLFEGLKSEKISRLYGFQSILQKTFFIISIVVFYERPLSQTLVCSSVLLGLLLISIYQFPYSAYKDVLSQFIPDVSLAFILFLCTLLAADEQINYFSYQQRYNVGWVMLAIISLSIIIQLLFIIKEAYEQILTKLKWIRSLIGQRI